MAFFAHVDGSNRVWDVQADATINEYKARFPQQVGGVWADHVFKEVTAGTVHWAVDNGDGTFTNPVVVINPPIARNASSSEVLSALPTGKAKLWAASDDDLAADKYILLTVAPFITPTEWNEIGDALQGATILSSAENATFKSAKPVSGG
jgi:hypothetical protein